MRVSTALTLFVSSMALVACGGTAEETLDLAGDAPCGLACPVVKLPPKEDDRTAPQPNTGNKEDISQEDGGDDTLVLESSVLKNLSSENPAYSILTESTSKKSAQIAIDPNIDNQETWPQPVDMTLFKSQSSALDGPGRYREYRALSRNESGNSVDEVLQVWRWSNSYATQYRDVSGGSEAVHQAVSFGGKRTTVVPTSGETTYRGRFGSTAKTFNWTDGADSTATLDINNIWQVNGSSLTTVDFAKGTVTGTLTPEKWQAFQSKSGKTGFLTVTNFDRATAPNPDNIFEFMTENIEISGKLSSDAVQGNKISGKARMESSEYVSGGNASVFKGALFGANAEELTGIFNVESVVPSPDGQDLPINDDRRSFVNHTGVVNGQK